ncbi:MAG: hypothetical protein ACSHXH_06360 [Marivita sp.]|uniref:hypothetical protein n=1 Tax=Marivita sp. TaxID=2003365 RepID=UPI003EF62B3B
MTRSFIISFALVAMSGVSGFALSTVHNQSVVTHAPVLTEPRPAETASGFVIPEFVPVTPSQTVPAALDVVATTVMTPVLSSEDPIVERTVNTSDLSPAASLRPTARTTDIVVTIPHELVVTPVVAPAKTSAQMAFMPKPRAQVLSTQSSSAPMIVSQVPRVTQARIISADYVVGVYR